MYARREEFSGIVGASPAKVFDRLDDQARLSAHMNKRIAENDARVASVRIGFEAELHVVDRQLRG